MKINVSGTNMEVGQALTSYVEEHLARDVHKYFENAVSALVHFTKENHHLIKVIITVNEGIKGGITVKSDAQAGDAYGAFTEALQKSAKQLRRYKRRIKNYRKKGGGIKNVEPNYQPFDATKSVLPPLDYENEIVQNEDLEEESAHIIAEKTTNIEVLSVNEAVMKMDLLDLPALVFINQDNGKINVVYHRKDGNISWINPKN